MSQKIDDYETSPDNCARYILGKYYERPLYFVGINPSVATKEKNDNTITIVENIAMQQGYDGYVMLNIYPVRATKLDNSFPRERDESIASNNLQSIECRIKSDDIIIAAWGTQILVRPFFIDSLIEINDVIKREKAKWLCLSKTKDGHPHHPTRLAYNNMTFEEFDMDRYIATCKMKSTKLHRRIIATE